MKVQINGNFKLVYKSSPKEGKPMYMRLATIDQPRMVEPSFAVDPAKMSGVEVGDYLQLTDIAEYSIFKNSDRENHTFNLSNSVKIVPMRMILETAK